jgi:hypothetical protein
LLAHLGAELLDLQLHPAHPRGQRFEQPESFLVIVHASRQGLFRHASSRSDSLRNACPGCADDGSIVGDRAQQVEAHTA